MKFYMLFPSCMVRLVTASASGFLHQLHMLGTQLATGGVLTAPD